jgi:SAM-dependent methyltransferase
MITDRDLWMLEAQAAARESQKAWSEHWSDDRQSSFSQRFFSFYRKAVFARTVRYFVGKYFPKQGRFLEAGSGTSETSLRIDKGNRDKTLVAVDIVPRVLRNCHPIMDHRVCGDIFRLPFQDSSIDGIWNVGVMEHFTHEQIDKIMRELHRVLKPGCRIVLLWPGADSIPQKMLRVVEKVINIKKKDETFRFHPPEISQLKSMKEGHQVLKRNGFECLHIDYGFRSLLAFKTVVGQKH